MVYLSGKHRDDRASRGDRHMANFSLETQRVLEANGWREDRHIDTSEYERALRAAGYEVCKPVCDFLQHYGDLNVVAKVEYDPWYNCLNTCLSEIMETDLVSYFSQGMSRTLYIIGKCDMDFRVLLMDSAGRVYRPREGQGYSMDLFLIAASGEEAIETLVREEQTGVDFPGEWIANWEGAALADGTIRFVCRVNPDYA